MLQKKMEMLRSLLIPKMRSNFKQYKIQLSTPNLKASYRLSDGYSSLNYGFKRVFK